MSSGTLCFTVKQLEERVSYPPPKKKVVWQEPHRSAESRRLLEEYKARIAAEALERQRFAIGSAPPTSPNSKKVASLSSAKLSSAPTPHSLIAAAAAAEADGKVEDAIGCLLEALRLCNPSRAIAGTPEAQLAAEVNERLGMYHVDKEMYNDAIAFFTSGVEVDPTYPRNYLHRAECYVLIDDAPRAFAEYEKYFKLEIPTKSQLVRCGKCALDADELDKAEYYLKLTLSCTASAGGNGGSKSNDSIADGAVQDASNDAYAYYNLGELCERRSHDELAREYFAKVVLTEPTFYVPYEEQAEAEYAAGNYTMALHLFESLAKILPGAPKYFVRLADIYEHLGEEFSSSVLSCLSRALQLKQDRADKEAALVRRGRLLFSGFDQVEEALADFSLCLSMNPRQHDALTYRALAYRQRRQEGDVEAAVADYRVLVSLDSVPHAALADPCLFLAGHAFENGDNLDAAKHYSLAQVYGAPLSRLDVLRMQLSLAHAAVHQGDNFDEVYEPRGWPQRDSNEKGKKSDPGAGRGAPVTSLSYWIVDGWYTTLRDREPTVHTDMEYQFIAVWKPYREEVERKREEAEAIRSGKKPSKKK